MLRGGEAGRLERACESATSTCGGATSMCGGATSTCESAICLQTMCLQPVAGGGG
jgi:hypothetical protein